MIDYLEFESYIKPIIEDMELFHRQAELLKQLYPSSHVIPESSSLIENYIRLLQKYINDDNDWIPYFVWECDCGKNSSEVEIGNKKIRLKTIKDLYNVISQEQ